MLVGRAASPGSFMGRAFVASDPAMASQITSIEVLVAPYVTPEWLRILIVCGAVVTERGGVASHPATLCRELGKPAVVAVPNATRLISTGDLVCVDGTEGTVEIRAT